MGPISNDEARSIRDFLEPVEKNHEDIQCDSRKRPAPINDNSSDEVANEPDIDAVVRSSTSDGYETETIHRRPSACILRFNVNPNIPVVDDQLVISGGMKRCAMLLQEYISCSMPVKYHVCPCK